MVRTADDFKNLLRLWASWSIVIELPLVGTRKRWDRNRQTFYTRSCRHRRKVLRLPPFLSLSCTEGLIQPLTKFVEAECFHSLKIACSNLGWTPPPVRFPPMRLEFWRATRHGPLRQTRSDNGPEFVNRTVDQWPTESTSVRQDKSNTIATDPIWSMEISWKWLYSLSQCVSNISILT